jgi:hypothetical protein
MWDDELLHMFLGLFSLMLYGEFAEPRTCVTFTNYVGISSRISYLFPFSGFALLFFYRVPFSPSRSARFQVGVIVIDEELTNGPGG